MLMKNITVSKAGVIILKKYWLEFLALVLYAVLIFIGIFHHEVWRDEAQAWLIARDLNPLQILNQMHYEGSPALWHLFNYPLAHFGLPIFSMQLLNGLFSLVAAGLILFFSPWPRPLKLAVIFSYYFIYEYPVIARSYMLAVLILFSLAAMYKKRFDRPFLYAIFIFLLSNTIVHFYLPAIVLGAWFIYDLRLRKIEMKKIVAISLLLGAGYLISLYQLFPAGDNFYAGAQEYFKNIEIFPFYNLFFLKLDAKSYWVYLALIPIAFFYFMAWFFFIRSKKIFVFSFLSFCWLMYIFVFRHSGSIRHHALILMLTLFCYWLAYPDGESDKKLVRWRTAINIVMVIFLIYPVFSGVNILYSDYKYKFSCSLEVSDYLRANHSNSNIIAYPFYEITPVLAYLPDARNWRVEYKDFGTYVTWDRQGKTLYKSPQNRLMTETEKSGFKEDYLLVLNQPLEAQYLNNYELIHACEHDYFGVSHSMESYYVYTKIKK